jgi:hypothetical protein
MHLGVFDSFVAKTELATRRKIDNTLVIPSLPSESVLCPVRAIKKYLAVVNSSRGQRNRLFIPLVGSKDLQPSTLTAWVRRLIIAAYEFAHKDKETANLFRAAHECRALASTWAALHNVSLDDIMSTAQWSSHTTFTNHYLKEMSLEQDGLLSLGPIVVAGAVV